MHRVKVGAGLENSPVAKQQKKTLRLWGWGQAGAGGRREGTTMRFRDATGGTAIRGSRKNKKLNLAAHDNTHSCPFFLTVPPTCLLAEGPTHHCLQADAV